MIIWYDKKKMKRYTCVKIGLIGLWFLLRSRFPPALLKQKRKKSALSSAYFFFRIKMFDSVDD